MARDRRKTSPRTIEGKLKAANAMKLRAQGFSFPDIATKAGYNSRQAAFAAVMRSLDETLREPADRLRTLEAVRLDAMWKEAFAAAQKGDAQAINACLSIMARRARMLGLDAPAKQQLTGDDGGPIELNSRIDVSAATDEQLRAVASIPVK